MQTLALRVNPKLSAYPGSEDVAKFLAAEMPRWADAVRLPGARMD